MEDLSADPGIPGSMCSGVHLKKEGRIYAVGYRRLGKEWKWRGHSFDGKEWSLIQ